MADLDEIVPMPDDMGPSGETLRARAQWGHQFAPPMSNLSARAKAQRARGNADKIAYATAIQDRRRADELAELKTNKDAQDLYFRNQKLAMDKMNAQATLAERAQRMSFQVQNQDALLKSRQAKAAADLALERRRTKENELAAITDAHEASFFADRADFLAKNPAATQEQIDAQDISLRDRYPHVRKSKDAGPILTLAERNSMNRQAEARKVDAEQMGGFNARVDAATIGAKPTGVTASGATTYEVPKPDNPDTYAKFNNELAEMVKSYGDQSKVPASEWARFEARKAALAAPATPASAGGAPTTAQQPAPPAAAARTAEEWLAANPNDPRAAKVRAKLGIK